MIAELLNAASFGEQFVEAPTTIDHESRFNLLNDESNLNEAMETMGRQLTEVSGIDCYTLNSLGLQYKLGDLVCDEQQIWTCKNEHQCKSF